MEITYCVTGTGAYITIKADRCETTVRLPNGMKRPARDLLDLADAEQDKAEAASRRAARLRAAAKHLQSKEGGNHE